MAIPDECRAHGHGPTVVHNNCFHLAICLFELEVVRPDNQTRRRFRVLTVRLIRCPKPNESIGHRIYISTFLNIIVIKLRENVRLWRDRLR